MAKYFCPKCEQLTFALRYQTGQKWYKIGKQWCAECVMTRNEKDCIKGLGELLKEKGGD